MARYIFIGHKWLRLPEICFSGRAEQMMCIFTGFIYIQLVTSLRSAQKRQNIIWSYWSPLNMKKIWRFIILYLIVSIMKNRTMNDGKFINELSCLYGIQNQSGEEISYE